jgi:hypothetical protein
VPQKTKIPCWKTESYVSMIPNCVKGVKNLHSLHMYLQYILVASLKSPVPVDQNLWKFKFFFYESVGRSFVAIPFYHIAVRVLRMEKYKHVSNIFFQILAPPKS